MDLTTMYSGKEEANSCTAEFARKKSAVLENYVRSVIHGICWTKHRKQEALTVVTGEPMRRMKISDVHEMEKHFDAIVGKLQIKPYPTLEALAHTYEIACQEYGAKGLNPLALWDMNRHRNERDGNRCRVAQAPLGGDAGDRVGYRGG